MSGLISLLSKGLSRVFSRHHSRKESLLQHSAFFMVQLSYLYMTTGKTTPLSIQTFVDKVLSLVFNKMSLVLSRFVIAFLPRSKCLLVSWLQSPSIVKNGYHLLKVSDVLNTMQSALHVLSYLSLKTNMKSEPTET